MKSLDDLNQGKTKQTLKFLNFLKKKDENIHKSEDLKSVGGTDEH